jgi:hypothetical protein
MMRINWLIFGHKQLRMRQLQAWARTGAGLVQAAVTRVIPVDRTSADSRIKEITRAILATDEIKTETGIEALAIQEARIKEIVEDGFVPKVET